MENTSNLMIGMAELKPFNEVANKMISSLEQLAKESTLFREVAEGKTSYHTEVEKLDPLYHGNFTDRFTRLFKNPEYDKVHLDRLVTDLNELSEHFGILGQPMPNFQQVERTAPQEFYPTRELTFIRGMGLVGLTGVLAIGISAYLNQDIPYPAFLLPLGAAFLGIGFPVIDVLDAYTCNSSYSYLHQWAGRVDSCLNGKLKEPAYAHLTSRQGALAFMEES